MMVACLPLVSALVIAAPGDTEEAILSLPTSRAWRVEPRSLAWPFSLPVLWALSASTGKSRVPAFPMWWAELRPGN